MAGLLASNGFNVLALGYFGVEHLPKGLVKIPLEYIQTAINWMVEQVDVQTGWLGVHGTSRGGEVALWSATLFPDIKQPFPLTDRLFPFPELYLGPMIHPYHLHGHLKMSHFRMLLQTIQFK